MAKQPILDQAFIDAFSNATVNTIKSMCSTQVTAGELFDKGHQTQAPAAISGLIGLTSAVVSGSITLSFSKKVFLTLMEYMFLEPQSELTKETEDAAAELLNIIFGQAKVALNEKGYAIQMAIPSVLRGSDIQSSYSHVHTAKVLPFKTSVGEFYVEFLLEPAKSVQTEKSLKPVPVLDTAAARALFFRPFIEGTIKTFKIQCGLEAKPGKPFNKKSSADYNFDVAGIIGITSDTLNGSFMISFKYDSFFKIMSKMLGEPITTFQPGLEDGVSEIVNIILGSAKVPLNEQGHNLRMAIPAAIRGETIIAAFQQKRPGIVIPFETELGGFFVEVSVE